MGNDDIAGGDFDDNISGQDGSDKIFGGRGEDRIWTSPGFHDRDFAKDTVDCGSDYDVVRLRASDGDTAASNCEAIDDEDR